MTIADVRYAPGPNARPRALVQTGRPSPSREQPAQRPRPARPQYARIDAGQLIRASALVLACVGFAQLMHAGNARIEKAPVAVAAATRTL